jgi:hypothetical protein
MSKFTHFFLDKENRLYYLGRKFVNLSGRERWKKTNTWPSARLVFS